MSCPDTAQKISDLEQELEQLGKLRRAFEAEQERLRPRSNAKEKPRVLTLFSGEKVEVDPGAFRDRLEADGLAMGEATIQQMVRAGFDGSEGPAGSTGRMVNYGQLDPSQENVAALLEVMGLRRANTAKGVELKQTFTGRVAARELMNIAQKANLDPRKIAEMLSKRAKGLDKLPGVVYTLAKQRWDSASQYADALEELADAIEGGYLTPELTDQAANIAKWAYYFEQLDASSRRYVGQALRSLQLNPDADLPVFDFSSDVRNLTLNEVKGGSLVSDMLKLTAEGNAKALRKRAAMKRQAKMLGAEVNEKGFMSQLRILNEFRKANLLSSIGTQVRNAASGALVQGVYMAEDTLSGTMRLVSKNGLKAGVADGLQASGYAARAFFSSWNMALDNGKQMLLEGRSTMTGDAPKYVQVQYLKDPEGQVNAAWQVFENSTTVEKLNPILLFNAANSIVFKKLGDFTKDKFGSDVGYGASFRLLNAGDEHVRTMSYVWKTSHEAFIRAADEGRMTGKSPEWIEKRADELTEGLIFKGHPSPDDLARFRKERNAQYGVDVGDEIDDDDLAMMLYDAYHNVPNTGTELGGIGAKRMADVTFTGELTDNVTGGIGQMRSNPVVGWMVPFFKVPINGVGWAMNRDLLVAIPKQLLMESQQALSKKASWDAMARNPEAANFTGEQISDALAAGQKFTPAEMAEARARTMVASAIAVTTYALWEGGWFTDGGGFDPRQRERERKLHSPYSFQLGGLLTPGGRFNISSGAAGVDLIDLMGLHADLSRARHEGVIGQNDYGAAVGLIVKAHAMLLQNKLSLRGITTFLNWAQDPERYDVSRLLSDQMGGILPLSGMLNMGARAFNDPNLGYAKRRTLSKAEEAAISKDPIYKAIEPALNLLRPIAQTIAQGNANYPLVGLSVPREKDWLGDSIVRPLGLSWDQVIPFMPVIRPNDPLRNWLSTHGFGDKPNPNAQVSVGGVELNMTNEEEDTFRVAMRESKAEYTPEDAGVSPGRLMPIWPYIQGKTMRQALQALSEDPRYNELLNTPVGGVSPSLSVQPGKSLTDRNAAGGDELYAPIDDIINYYEQLGLMKMMQSHPQFKGRFDQILRDKQRGMEAYAGSVGLQQMP